MKEIFENIIKNRYWRDSTCGSGSTLEYTKKLREQLPEFLIKHKITSMLDAPCGDHSWMSLIKFPNHFKYTGGDIVNFMIEENRSKYPDKEFIQLDITQTSLPDVDLLFCRDCLFHFSLEDIAQAFDNIAKSSVKYIMLTSYYNGTTADIKTGEFRNLDFSLAPFNFPDPIDSIEDWIPGHNQRRMCLWSIDVIRKYLNEKTISNMA